MIEECLVAGKVVDSGVLQGVVIKGLDWLCEHMVHKNGNMYHYMLNGQAELPGQLGDQVWMIRALLDAYDLLERKSYLEMAIALMHFACQELLDDQSGLFYDYVENAQAEGRLAIREQPL